MAGNGDNAAESDPAGSIDAFWLEVRRFVNDRLGAHHPTDVISLTHPDTGENMEVTQVPSRYDRLAGGLWRTLNVRSGLAAATFHQTSTTEAMYVPPDVDAAWEVGSRSRLGEMAVRFEGFVNAMRQQPELVQVNHKPVPVHR
ncbi:MAG TPA: hypothetical protein VLF40_04295 [Candidatus Saccharimonadales bacterium]|nr:hypothetical protein [Candidatus Saccharimonadales bacterium]